MRRYVGHVFLWSLCHEFVVRYRRRGPATLDNLEMNSKGLFLLFHMTRTRNDNVNGSNGTSTETSTQQKPIQPRTEFGNLSTFNQQSFSATIKNTARRIFTAKQRRKSSKAAVKNALRIKLWKTLITHCSSVDLIFTSHNASIRLCKLSDSFPPDVLFFIQIDSSSSIKTFRSSTLISLYPLFSGSFLPKLT